MKRAIILITVLTLGCLACALTVDLLQHHTAKAYLAEMPALREMALAEDWRQARPGISSCKRIGSGRPFCWTASSAMSIPGRWPPRSARWKPPLTWAGRRRSSGPWTR